VQPKGKLIRIVTEKKYKFEARELIYIDFVLMPDHYRLTMKLFWIFRGPFVGVPA